MASLAGHLWKCARRILSGALCTAPIRAPQNVSTLFTGSATLVSLEQWAIDLDYRRGTRGLEVVRRALDSLLPDVRFEGIDKERRRLQDPNA